MQHCRHILIVAAVVLAAAVVRGHETDQYSVPLGREYAELGPYFSDGYREAIVRGVAILNGQIAATLQDGAPTAATQRYYTPETVTSTIYHALPMWLTWVEPIESRLLSAEQRNRYPGRLTVHHPPSWIYHHWALLLDPTKLPRLVRCGTITIDGVEVGTDKLMHFAHMGFYYVQTYNRSRANGRSVEQSMQAAVDLGTGSNPFLSEGTWLGLLSTGVWSNSDLAVNYVGMLFFRNLTEPVQLRGQTQTPLLVRDGHFWRLSDTLRRDREFLSRFVTDHWNEVVNPNEYTILVEPFVRGAVRSRCAAATAWYRDRHLSALSRAELLQRMIELSTYYGENYGYRGDPAQHVSLLTACTLPEKVPVSSGCGIEGRSESCDALGRTALWWAAADGDAAAVGELLAQGADAAAADVDGETPLHAAARLDRAAIIAPLVGAGAEVNARALYGATPLHVAARAGNADAVGAMLAVSADANATDDFGVTPLEDAALQGLSAIVEMLLSGGGDVQRMRHGVALSQRVRRAGYVRLADRLATLEAPAP